MSWRSGCSACNDVDPIITYRGIAARVLWPKKTDHLKLREELKNLPPEDARKRKLEAWKPLEVEARKLVTDWPELFSSVVATVWFDAWRVWVTDDGHYPRWVTDLWPGPKTAAITARRKEEIENLKREDVFRGQFRSHDRSERCTTEQVKLGVEHLAMERRDERLKLYTFGSSAAGAALRVFGVHLHQLAS